MRSLSYKQFLKPLLWLTLCLFNALPSLAEVELAKVESPNFEEHIRPILKEHCFACHGETGVREGELDLRLKRLMLSGGDSGPALTEGSREESYLFERVESGDMPPGEVKMKPEEIELLGRWIDAGAPTIRPEPDEIGEGYYFTQEDRSFWAFQPIANVAVPEVASHARIRTPVDAFLLAKMQSEGLTFADDTDKITLLRRVCFDLTGLPPTPEQVKLFLADQAPDAYERLIDRLLASPHYGERWGRHWLDTAGYAESEGYSPADPPTRTRIQISRLCHSFVQCRQTS